MSFKEYILHPLRFASHAAVVVGFTGMIYYDIKIGSIDKPECMKQQDRLAEILKGEQIRGIDLAHPTARTRSLLAIVDEYTALEKDQACMAESQRYALERADAEKRMGGKQNACTFFMLGGLFALVTHSLQGTVERYRGKKTASSQETS